MSTRDNRHWRRRIFRQLAGLGLGGLFCALTMLEAAASPTEAELRAAVIVAIMRFTAWPQLTPEPDPTIEVCLAGQPTSEAQLMPITGRQKVAGRTLVVMAASQSNPLDCEVLVLGENPEDGQGEQFLEALDSQPVLTVCDGCRREQSGRTIIHLTLRKQRVNFEVNLAKAKRNGLGLDAQLLELASGVRK